MHASTRGVILAIISATSFGVAGPFSKAVLVSGALSPYRLAQFRISGAAVVLLIFVGLGRLRRGRDSYRWTRADAGLVIAYGALGFVGVQICYFIAIDRLPVGVALLVIVFEPHAAVMTRTTPKVIENKSSDFFIT